MSSVRFEPYAIPSADLGECNPLPDIHNVEYIHAGFSLSPRVTPEELPHIGQGRIPTLLPYMQQDNYNRHRRAKIYQAAILENHMLKAVFLPELGGRLWSLYHKGLERELLYKNPVFQPANLALRNAWFSGGVEWNVGIKGHNPLTCSPMFAQHLRLADDTDVLRLYEYERIRGVAYSLDIWLPEDSPVLLIRPRIENTQDRDVYMYWWSNIAVPETEGTRVIVPADHSYVSYYNEGSYLLDSIPLPEALGTDVSYPANSKRSLDFFYQLPETEDKWIAAVDANGQGLVQCSTRDMIGRKLFVWGQGHGGRNWNRFLSDGSGSYIEIQAGLSRVQLEHLPMPAHSVWEWMEAYGAVDCPPERVHTADWAEARRSIETCLHGYFPQGIQQALETHSRAARQFVQDDTIQHGSGWGALANLERQAQSRPPVSDQLLFPKESLGREQEDWLALLHTGKLPCPSAQEPPTSYVVTPFWYALLRESVKNGCSDHWFGWLHLGVMAYANGETDTAVSCWHTSLQREPSPWAYRNLSMAYLHERHDSAAARQFMLQAITLNRCSRNLLVDCGMVLLAAKDYLGWLDIFSSLPEPLQQNGRLRLLQATALLELNRLPEAAAVLNPSFEMDDIKEGDVILCQTWYRLYGAILRDETGETDEVALKALVDQRFPLGHLDFRMHQ